MSTSKLQNRRGLALETWLTRMLAGGTALFAVVYVLGLVFLLGRGGQRIASFTSIATPLSDIDGESSVRLIIALAVFGSIGWASAQLLRPLTIRIGPKASRNTLALFAVAAAIAALLFRDHLPRFLVSMPSETQAGGGVGPQIFNTLYAAALSTAVTMPIGLGAAIYMSKFAKSRRFVGALRTALDTLASLPSIVYGLFGFLVFVVQMRAGYSLFAGAFVLSILNLPLVVGIAEESLRAVPRELEEASFALGANDVQTAFRVSVPYAWPGVLSALVLSVGRVFSESAPLIMTAGTTVSRANAYSLDPMRGGETLAVHLWYVNSAGLSPDKAEVSAGTAAVLVALILATNTLAAFLGRYGGATGSGRLRRATR